MADEAAFAVYGFKPPRVFVIELQQEAFSDAIAKDLSGALGRAAYFQYEGDRLVDKTDSFHQDPTSFVLKWSAGSSVDLQISPREVVAGRDKITFCVVNLGVAEFDLAYSLNRSLMPIATHWRADCKGCLTIIADDNTRKGSYHFLAVRNSADPRAIWQKVDAKVVIR